MRLEKTKNTRRGIVVGVINRVILIIVPFFIRTAFIRNLGADYLGLNSLMYSLINVLNVSELGFGGAIIYSMYEPIAFDYKDEVSALLKYYKTVYMRIGIFVFMAGLMIMPFIPFLIEGSVPASINIYLVFFLYLLNTVSSYLFLAYRRSLLDAHQRRDITAAINLLFTGTTSIIQLLIIMYYKNPYAYYAFLLLKLATTVLDNLACYLVSKKKYPDVHCKGEIQKEKRDEIGLQVRGLVINKIGIMSRNTFDSVFVSMFLGLVMTAIYNNYYMIVSSTFMMIHNITSSMQAGIGNSMQVDSREKNYVDFCRFNFMYVWICGCASIMMLCCYKTFMLIWVGQDLTADDSMSILFALYFFVACVGDIRVTYSNAAGLWWENRYWMVVEIVCNLVLNLLFVRMWGIYGIIWATIIPLVLVDNFFGARVLFQYYFKNNMLKKYILSMAVYAVVTAIAAVAAYIACNRIPQSFRGLLIRVLISAIVSNLVFLVFYVRSENFKYARRWVSGLIG